MQVRFPIGSSRYMVGSIGLLAPYWLHRYDTGKDAAVAKLVMSVPRHLELEELSNKTSDPTRKEQRIEMEGIESQQANIFEACGMIQTTG